jgi:hypothetical protein
LSKILPDLQNDEKEDSPPESEDVPENEITSLQKFKSVLGIQRDMPVQITSKMMMEGVGKARKRGINLNLAPVIILDFAGQEVFYSTQHCLNHPLHLVSLCPVCVSLF